jgi:hypothetical protein
MKHIQLFEDYKINEKLKIIDNDVVLDIEDIEKLQNLPDEEFKKTIINYYNVYLKSFENFSDEENLTLTEFKEKYKDTDQIKITYHNNISNYDDIILDVKYDKRLSLITALNKKLIYDLRWRMGYKLIDQKIKKERPEFSKSGNYRPIGNAILKYRKYNPQISQITNLNDLKEKYKDNDQIKISYKNEYIILKIKYKKHFSLIIALKYHLTEEIKNLMSDIEELGYKLVDKEIKKDENEKPIGEAILRYYNPNLISKNQTFSKLKNFFGRNIISIPKNDFIKIIGFPASKFKRKILQYYDNI